MIARVLNIVFTVQVVFLLFFVSLYKTGVTLYYLLNKSYIENNLCVNRDKAALNCHGKCYLTLSINKHDAGLDNDYILKKLVDVSDKEYYQEGMVWDYTIVLSDLRLLKEYLENYQYLYSYSCFHPPTVC